MEKESGRKGMPDPQEDPIPFETISKSPKVWKILSCKGRFSAVTATASNYLPQTFQTFDFRNS